MFAITRLEVHLVVTTLLQSSHPDPTWTAGSSSTLLVRHSSGTLTWIRQQATSRPTGIAPSMSPWTIKVATQNRVQHQEGRGHLPLRAEV